MKTTFSILLICLLANLMSAQTDQSNWSITDAILQLDGRSIARRYHQFIKMDTVRSGQRAGMQYERFQEKIELATGCEITLPADELIWKWNEHFVITAQQKYGEVYQTRLSSYSIKDCSLQLLGSMMVPMEHELFINEYGELILSDMYMGYGRELTLLDKQLKAKASFSPFEKGFTYLHAEDAGDHWWVILTEESKNHAASLYTLSKEQGALEMVMDLPFQPEGWNGFTPYEKGILIYRFGELTSYNLAGEKLWERADDLAWISLKNDHLLLAKTDRVSALDIATGKQRWAWHLADLRKEKRHDLQKDRSYFLYHQLKQNEKGILLITYKTDGGWTIPSLKSDIQINFIDHSGSVLLDQKIKGSHYFIRALLNQNSITLLLGDETTSYEIPE